MTPQQRYEAHQARKREVLIRLMEERHSERMFDEKPVSVEDLNDFLCLKDNAPSSCDRRGITVTWESGRDNKALLGGVLVGGTGWIHRAPLVLLFWGDPEAYIAGAERNWNPYLDTGFLASHMLLLATAKGMKGCFVNPGIREFNKSHFQMMFSPMFGDDPEMPIQGIYCGALALGWPKN